MLGLAIVALPGCQSVNKVSLRNLSVLYQPEVIFSELESVVYHNNDSVSTLFVKVPFNNLVYKKDPASGRYSCSYRLSYKLTSGYESAEVISSASILAGDSVNYGRSAGITHNFEFRAGYPGKYLLEISLMDFNREAAVTRFLTVNKQSMNGRQNFLVTSRSNELIFKDYFPAEEPFKVYLDDHGLLELTVNYYFRDFPPARPPYTEDREPVFKFRPDSVFSVPVLNGASDWLELPGPGFYHFRKDTLSREGMTIFRYPGGFPEITSAEQLKAPLRYITTRKEFDSLVLSTNVKASVDEFWLKTARTPERALVLLQKYYTQVEEANRFFTSYHEGWKTDRGLIYTVFGKPTYVYRGDKLEEWVYGEPQNRSALRFTFIQVNNPFTDNDYMLLRSPTFKDPWFITVQSWRR